MWLRLVRLDARHLPCFTSSSTGSDHEIIPQIFNKILSLCHSRTLAVCNAVLVWFSCVCRMHGVTAQLQHKSCSQCRVFVIEQHSHPNNWPVSGCIKYFLHPCKQRTTSTTMLCMNWCASLSMQRVFLPPALVYNHFFIILKRDACYSSNLIHTHTHCVWLPI